MMNDDDDDVDDDDNDDNDDDDDVDDEDDHHHHHEMAQLRLSLFMSGCFQTAFLYWNPMQPTPPA